MSAGNGAKAVGPRSCHQSVSPPFGWSIPRCSAYQRASAVEQFLGEHYQLVGDAPSDILAAKANQARAVAVHTGISTREELAAHQPDVVIPDLGELRVEFLLHTP